MSFYHCGMHNIILWRMRDEGAEWYTTRDLIIVLHNHWDDKNPVIYNIGPYRNKQEIITLPTCPPTDAGENKQKISINYSLTVNSFSICFNALESFSKFSSSSRMVCWNFSKCFILGQGELDWMTMPFCTDSAQTTVPTLTGIAVFVPPPSSDVSVQTSLTVQ